MPNLGYPPQVHPSQGLFLPSPGWHTKQWFTNQSPHLDSNKRGTTEAGQSRWVGDRVNKQGNLLMRLVLGGHKTSRSPHLHTIIFRVYTEFIQSLYRGHQCSVIICHLYRLNTSLSQGLALEMAQAVGTVGRVSIPRRGEEVKSLQPPRASLWVNGQSRTLSDLFLHPPELRRNIFPTA